MRTPFELERNASLFYPQTVSRHVQNEMYLSMVSCSQICISTFEDVDECLVKEFIHYNSSNSNGSHIDPEVENDYQWDILIRESTYKFQQFGILCRHIFIVIKSYNIKEIPSKYLLRCWKKDIIPTKLLKRCFRYADSDETTQRVALDIFSTVDNCVSSLSNDHTKLNEYLHEIKQMEEKFLSNFRTHDK
ncbi:protein FAR1-RELATED SEQUENCE 12-like [Lactuca sativa]|uniref:protein FAR1-RELATED SEQUENCE 12-like n=1 Tax=Lactuca sativa TaxID=4236 RepID=UPI000CD9CA16|nr:protein FAR1-RELATED SEQUENCE 12-like [Lactuca sativa]